MLFAACVNNDIIVDCTLCVPSSVRLAAGWVEVASKCVHYRLYAFGWLVALLVTSISVESANMHPM